MFAGVLQNVPNVLANCLERHTGFGNISRSLYSAEQLMQTCKQPTDFEVLCPLLLRCRV